MDKRLKKAGIVLLIYLFFCIIRLITKDSILNEFKIAVGNTVKNFIVASVNQNINVFGFIKQNNSDEDKELYEKLGQNTGYFAYLLEKANDIKLVVYDPNINLSVENVPKDSNNLNDNNTLKENSTENGAASDETVNAGLTHGITYSMEQLSDFNFVVNNMYVVTERAKLLESDLNAEELLNIDLSIKGSNDKPQILIYHTHSHEGFVDTTGENTSNIVAVGSYLAEILSSEYGYSVIHCTESFDEVNGVFDRSKAYTYATPALEQILAENPSIEVVLDIHRDGLKEGSAKLLTNINGKPTAQIMFFNGISRNNNGEIGYLYNQYRKENLALSFQMKLKAMELYPDFTRRNYIDAYQYNLHLRPCSMLIEVGAQNNTFEEAKNAMEPLAEILDKILKGE
ncbi:MAG: stage II sporulation protein P [Lachnospiraceae bacterium]|nr:stage II sporulation protein P [Lachnospiraceae bacterium]